MEHEYMLIEDWKAIKALEKKRYLLEQRIAKLYRQVKRINREIEDRQEEL